MLFHPSTLLLCLFNQEIAQSLLETTNHYICVAGIKLHVHIPWHFSKIIHKSHSKNGLCPHQRKRLKTGQSVYNESTRKVKTYCPCIMVFSRGSHYLLCDTIQIYTMKHIFGQVSQFANSYIKFHINSGISTIQRCLIF